VLHVPHRPALPFACRWFPQGQVVFLAPTRPLVSQQVEACFKIVGIPMAHTAQVQGTVKAADREAYWADRRVFYATPQTFFNDMKEGRCNPRRVVAVVIDEGGWLPPRGRAGRMLAGDLHARAASTRG